MRSLLAVLTAALIVAACADDTSPADPGAEPTAPAPDGPSLIDVFAVADEWRVAEIDGQPVVDGPTMRTGDGIDGADAIIGGCMLGTDYPVSLSVRSTLHVDRTRPLSDYDCVPERSPTAAALREVLDEVLFADPTLELATHRLTLATSSARLTLRRSPTTAELHGEWSIAGIDGNDVGSRLALAFAEPGSDQDHGDADMLACGLTWASVRYSGVEAFDHVARIQDPTACTDDTAVTEAETVDAALSGGARFFLTSEDDVELVGGGHLLSLRRGLTLTPRDDAEVFVLPSTLPAGFEYVGAATPTSDSHPTFVGEVTASAPELTVRLSLRWTSRPGWVGVQEDGPGEGDAGERGGRTVYTWPGERMVRVPYTAATDVWLWFDQPVDAVPADLVDMLIESLTEVPRDAWLALVGDPE